jgi:hypothetical protein
MKTSRNYEAEAEELWELMTPRLPFVRAALGDETREAIQAIQQLHAEAGEWDPIAEAEELWDLIMPHLPAIQAALGDETREAMQAVQRRHARAGGDRPGIR